MNRFVFVVLVAGAMASGAWADGHSASGDASAGEVAFNKQCIACHVVVTDAGEKLAGRNSKSGPNLYNIAGATAGAVPGYRYGKSLVKAGAELGLICTQETFSAYVQDPMDFLKVFLDDKGARAKMSFKVRKEEDARNIYAYLYSIGSK